ncbi:hypothetical protein BKA15_004064 [Microlunatus parietis]|uniref:Uncharacterized protein n=1 Tax=Microlunatus parietis TaxID=682979 RepID=A0A7Y9LDG0_9ACTN|nr:hypothetical protein [Microlunatus parietis]
MRRSGLGCCGIAARVGCLRDAGRVGLTAGWLVGFWPGRPRRRSGRTAGTWAGVRRGAERRECGGGPAAASAEVSGSDHGCGGPGWAAAGSPPESAVCGCRPGRLPAGWLVEFWAGADRGAGPAGRQRRGPGVGCVGLDRPPKRCSRTSEELGPSAGRCGAGQPLWAPASADVSGTDHGTRRSGLGCCGDRRRVSRAGRSRKVPLARPRGGADPARPPGGAGPRRLVARGRAGRSRKVPLARPRGGADRARPRAGSALASSWRGAGRAGAGGCPRARLRGAGPG